MLAKKCQLIAQGGVVCVCVGMYGLWCWLGDFKPQVEAKQLMKFSLKEAAAKKQN